MAHRLVRDEEKDGWERSDFPIVCETCLGPDPYVRMQRMEFGGQCHISNRPYTVFRWRPGNDARYKKTIICQDVAKAKNVCQVCLNDLDYNVPVQVRDQALGVSAEDSALPESTAGREFALNAMAEQGLLADKKRFEAAGAGEAVLERLKRDSGNFKRNRAKICSFFVKGTCTRGAECPYRHEMPEEGHDKGFSMKNVRARYHGVDDPNAKKMLDRMNGKASDSGATTSSLEPPADRSIATLFVGGVGEGVSEDDIRAALEGAGELKSVKKLGARKCAFATFRKREGAEAAMRVHGAGGLRVATSDKPLTLLWGKPKKGGEAQKDKDTRAVGIGVGSGGGKYSSQAADRDGAALEEEEEAEEKTKTKKKSRR